MTMHWAHNPVLHYEPFSPNLRENKRRDANEICVAVVRARGLVPPDPDGGPPDASVCLKIPTKDGRDFEHEEETAACYETDEPTWKEAFFMVLEDPAMQTELPPLEVTALSRGLSVGVATVDLNVAKDRRIHTFWVPLTDLMEGEPTGEVEIRLMLRFNPDLDRFFDPHEKERAAAAAAARNAGLYLIKLHKERKAAAEKANELEYHRRMAQEASLRPRGYALREGRRQRPRWRRGRGDVAAVALPRQCDDLQT